MANVTINVDDDKEVTIPKICKVSTKYRRKQRTLQSPTFAETNNQINKTMAKEIIIETYKQRCECLGAEGMALDSILNLNNIFLPTPLVMSIRDSLKAYKVSKGEIQVADVVAIKKDAYKKYHEIVGEGVRSAVDADEYEMQYLRECLDGWIHRGAKWEQEKLDLKAQIRNLKRKLGR